MRYILTLPRTLIALALGITVLFASAWMLNGCINEAMSAPALERATTEATLIARIGAEGNAGREISLIELEEETVGIYQMPASLADAPTLLLNETAFRGSDVNVTVHDEYANVTVRFKIAPDLREQAIQTHLNRPRLYAYKFSFGYVLLLITAVYYRVFVRATLDADRAAARRRAMPAADSP